MTFKVRLRQHAELARVVNHELGAPVVGRDRSREFDAMTGERAEVAELAAVGREDHAGERAIAIVGAEVQKSVAATRGERAHDAALNASGLAGVRTSVLDVQAGALSAGGGERIATSDTRVPCSKMIRHHGADTGNNHNHERHNANLPACHIMRVALPPPGLRRWERWTRTVCKCLFRSGCHNLLPARGFRTRAEIRLSCTDPCSIPKRTHEGRRRLEPLLGERTHEFLKRRPVLRIDVTVTGYGRMIRTEDQITVLVALQVLSEDTRPH